MNADLRLIAFYLPQYHPIPENDNWWGDQFTDWVNVLKAEPLFKGHYQPHLPGDLGAYDLRSSVVREKQAKLAQQYGITGFCYYHYWFNGKRLLERPFEDVLVSGNPHFPFCLCWANENWTRAWNGRNKEILIKQTYNKEDDLRHILYLIKAFRDSRYITIEGKPVFLIYRAESIPFLLERIETWRNEVKKAGLKGLYLICVESFKSNLNPQVINFDAALDFAPDWRNLGLLIGRSQLTHFLVRLMGFLGCRRKPCVYDYQEMVSRILNKRKSVYKRFYCVNPGFDNSARRAENATILLNSHPDIYQRWLTEAIRMTKQDFMQEERMVFINAWNEWAEGNHLEPDKYWGTAYLQATLNAVNISKKESCKI